MITGTFGRAAFTFGSISSPLMPGMLMSDKTREESPLLLTCSRGCRCRVGKLHDKTSRANVAAELLAKQVFDVGFRHRLEEEVRRQRHEEA
jgi:hypothetical protein